MSAYNYALLEISFPNHVTFSSKYDVEEYIEEKQSTIDYCKQKLHAYMLMTEPKKFIDDDYDPIPYLNNQFDEIMEDLEEAIYWKGMAQKLHEAWDDMHEDGKVKWNPLVHDRMKESQYFGGDYVQYTNQDDELWLDDDDYEVILNTAKEKVNEKNRKRKEKAREDHEKYLKWCTENGKNPDDFESTYLYEKSQKG